MRFASRPRQWNEAAMRRIATRLERPRPSAWALIGALALGLVAGAAIGGYAVSRRSLLKRVSTFVRRPHLGPADMGAESEPEDVLTVTPSNHRRKAISEV